MDANLKVTLLNSADSHVWDDYVGKSTLATLSHKCCWRRIITKAYGHSTFYLMAHRGDEVVGILPLVWVKNAFLGNTLSSMPYQDYGGIAADDPVVGRFILDRALDLRQKCRAPLLELRHREALSDDGKASLRADKAVMLLDLSKGSEFLWKNISGKVRNQVRKAQKSGLTTHLGGAELLGEFYKVFVVNMRDLGSPVHHVSFFAALFSEFGDKARLLIVRDNNKTIGGLICLFYKDTIAVPWASSLRESFSKCPNNLLYWDAIQIACDRGYKVFDFGRSTIGSGTYNFKLQWGAQPVQLNWQLFFSHGKPMQLPEESVKYRLAATIWSHLPPSLTLFLGPPLRKYLTN
jgi:serine/alanine adding enzyme